MPKVRTIDTLPLDGGVLCFHFINTVYAWRGINFHEYLHDYETVIKWCKKVNILDAAKRRDLLTEAKLHPAKAVKALQQLKQIRETLYHFFSAIAAQDGKQISTRILYDFNSALTHSLSHLGFAVQRKQVELTWNNSSKDLLEPVWIVVKSAYDILTTQPRSRIKECSNCGWIFFDNTKNNKRRWCNPLSCGSIEKSKKYYQKIRSAQE